MAQASLSTVAGLTSFMSTGSVYKRTKRIVEGKTVLEYTRPQLDERDADAAKLIKDGPNSIASDGNLHTYFEVRPEHLEEDLGKGFDGLAKKLKSLGATQTNLCESCRCL